MSGTDDSVFTGSLVSMVMGSAVPHPHFPLRGMAAVMLLQLQGFPFW